MIHIRTASRLHFGLLSLPEGDRTTWPDREGRPVVPARRFGGLGLMVEEPGVALSVHAAPAWSAVGPSAQRALDLAQRFAQSLPRHMVRPCAIAMHRCARQHVGLGSGTQLGLAIARAVNLELGMRPLDVAALSASVGRGLRSGVGAHGFVEGGLIVDGGRRQDNGIAPIVARHAFPEEWPILFVVPQGEAGRHGPAEAALFEELLHEPPSLAATEALCRLVLLGVLPAVSERDYASLAEALFDFNARAGELFAPVQHGIYQSALTAELIRCLRANGVQAAGQSSWGPAVFGISDDPEKADSAARAISDQFNLSPDEVIVTRACNHGARVTIG
jgi:beta-RFAP synthase